MKKLLLVFILFVCFTNIHASDTLNTHTYIRIDDSFEVKGHAYDSIGNYNYIHKKFRIGLAVCPLTFDNWSNTGGLKIINGNGFGREPYTGSHTFFRPFGISFGYRLFRSIYLQSGVIFTEQYINDLEWKIPDPKQRNYDDVYSYKSNYFQVPISITYTLKARISPYINIGVKNNFIYKQHFYGKDLVSGSYNSSGVFTGNYVDIDESDKNVRLSSIIPYLNWGLLVLTKKRRLGYMVYFSFDLPAIYDKENTIPDFTFQEYSLINFQIFYNF